MSTVRLVELSVVWGMLDNCAHGWTKKDQTHNWKITFNSKQHWLKAGAHGKRDPQIEAGHVRNMARFFGFLECAKHNIRGL